MSIPASVVMVVMYWSIATTKKGGVWRTGSSVTRRKKKKKNSFGKDALFATNPNLGRRLVEPAGHENELGANFVFMDPRVRADV